MGSPHHRWCIFTLVLTWPISLDDPPEVVALAQARHGVDTLVEDWLLPDLWAMHFYRYDARLVVDDVPVRIRPGSVSVIAPGARMHYEYHGPSEHVYAHLRIAQAPARQRIRLFDPLTGDGGYVRRCWEAALVAQPTAPRRTVAAAWDLLWRLAGRTGVNPGGESDHHPAVAAALQHIGSHLDRPLSIADLATAAGVSHNHLTRLFRREFDCTPVAFVRRQRLAQAAHLLRNSTLPVKRIARMVGVPDLQAFNKACRRELGASPSAIRAGQ